LQNVIEHAVVLLEPGAELRAEDLPFVQGGALGGGGSGGAGGALSTASTSEGSAQAPLVPADSQVVPMPLEETYHVARERLLAEFERRYLTWLVAQARNNISKAARLAAVDRTTLYRLMERHGLQRAVSPAPSSSLDGEQ